MKAFASHITKTKDVLRHSGTAAVGVFALSVDDKLVHVDDVSSSVKNLRCPDCGGEVRPRKCGENRRDHFFHLKESACDFVGETALHRLAKMALSERQEVCIPRLCVMRRMDGSRVWEIFEKGAWRLSLNDNERRAVRSIGLRDVVLEEWQGGFRPDISAFDEKGRHLFVELKVTHKVNKEKKNLLKERGVSTLEIDLTTTPSDLTWEDFCDWVVFKAPREWVYNEVLDIKLEQIDYEDKSQKANKFVQTAMEEFRKEVRAFEEAMEAVGIWSAPVAPSDRVRGTVRHEKLQAALMRHVSSVSIDICVLEHSGSFCDQSSFLIDDNLLFLEIFDICVVKTVSRLLSDAEKRPRWDIPFVTVKAVVGQLQRKGWLKDKMVDCHGDMFDLCKNINPDFLSPFEKVEMILKELSALGFLSFEKESSKTIERCYFQLDTKFFHRVEKESMTLSSKNQSFPSHISV